MTNKLLKHVYRFLFLFGLTLVTQLIMVTRSLDLKHISIILITAAFGTGLGYLMERGAHKQIMNRHK